MAHLDQWHEMWNESDNPAFHFPVVHEHLTLMSDDFLPKDKQLAIFVPLCGKSVDLLFFYNLGYTVIGLEISEKALQLVGQENNLSLTAQSIEGFGTVFKTDDNRMHLYCGDLFQFGPNLLPAGVEIGAVFDQKSVVAIDPPFRDKYFDVMRLLGKCSKYLVTLVRHDWGMFPPHVVPKQYVQEQLEGMGLKEMKNATVDHIIEGRTGPLFEDTYLFTK